MTIIDENEFLDGPGICSKCKNLLSCSKFDDDSSCPDFEPSIQNLDKFKMPKFDVVKEKIQDLKNISDEERRVLFLMVDQLGFLLCVSDIMREMRFSRNRANQIVNSLIRKKLIKITLYDDRKNRKNVEFLF
jgi:hypothetical protein